MYLWRSLDIKMGFLEFHRSKFWQPDRYQSVERFMLSDIQIGGSNPIIGQCFFLLLFGQPLKKMQKWIDPKGAHEMYGDMGSRVSENKQAKLILGAVAYQQKVFACREKRWLCLCIQCVHDIGRRFQAIIQSTYERGRLKIPIDVDHFVRKCPCDLF